MHDLKVTTIFFKGVYSERFIFLFVPLPCCFSSPQKKNPYYVFGLSFSVLCHKPKHIRVPHFLLNAVAAPCFLQLTKYAKHHCVSCMRTFLLPMYRLMMVFPCAHEPELVYLAGPLLVDVWPVHSYSITASTNDQNLRGFNSTSVLLYSSVAQRSSLGSMGQNHDHQGVGRVP